VGIVNEVIESALSTIHCLRIDTSKPVRVIRVLIKTRCRVKEILPKRRQHFMLQECLRVSQYRIDHTSEPP
jgi:hypothetical protein